MKKYYVFFIILFILSLFIKTKASYKKVIYIDPGHGGTDPGAIYKNIKEDKINLDISLILKKEFEGNGFKVYMTRNGNYDLSATKSNRKKSDFNNRIKLINNSNANIYLSIHLNNDINELSKGPQVFYIKGNEKLANIIQKNLNKKYNQEKKIKEINNVYMYKRLSKDGVLLELGFLSNYDDRNNLQNNKYVKELSKIIVNSVVKYIS